MALMRMPARAPGFGEAMQEVDKDATGEKNIGSSSSEVTVVYCLERCFFTQPIIYMVPVFSPSEGQNMGHALPILRTNPPWLLL